MRKINFFGLAVVFVLFAGLVQAVTLTGTVKYPNGTAVDSGKVFLYDIVNLINVSNEIYANYTIINTSIVSDGVYSFDSLNDFEVYTLVGIFEDTSNNVYVSDPLNNSVIMNGSFANYFNTTYNLTFLNSSTGTAEYNITVRSI